MSYRLDIKDNSLCIQGLYGAYEAIDDGKGGLSYGFDSKSAGIFR